MLGKIRQGRAGSAVTTQWRLRLALAGTAPLEVGRNGGDGCDCSLPVPYCRVTRLCLLSYSDCSAALTVARPVRYLLHPTALTFVSKTAIQSF